ncbi:MAG: hypothetical protein IT447_03740 [Phycisphaerales bacterium]|jgi:hypothetical protein|nr:hypothetical protein [Phycisphaerales bacterium]
MHSTQPRPTPLRIYEPNIIHNPKTWMGIWTPHGWRVHQKRWGKAKCITVKLSGDGKTTFFPRALLDPKTSRVEWQDDLHLKDDPYTDGGIYPSDPRVEYPAGRPRWAVSHTLLCYPVCDHNLYTHEYTWDMTHGHLQTHFRNHVLLEEARTDSRDGKTVRIRNTPISQTIEGNVHYPMPNSAVRGVWADPDKRGENLYTKRIVQLIPMHNGVYGISPKLPVVQCHGMFQVLANDPLDKAFDSTTGLCTDPARVIEQMLIPLDEPKIAFLKLSIKLVKSKLYQGDIGMIDQPYAVVDEAHIARARERIGSRFVMGRVGYGYENAIGKAHDYNGYEHFFDLNNDGLIDEADIQRISRHLGRKVRHNIYHGAYFGGDWLSTTICLNNEHTPGTPCIADYEYGGGYDAQTGVIHLLNTPGPDQPVWVEYHHDAPAEAGDENIVLHLYRETGV